MSAVTYGHRDVLVPLFVASVNDITTRAEQQTAALDNHLPTAIFCLVVLCALMGAMLLGIAFGRTGSPHIALAVLYCTLCAATVFAITDLDHAHGGFIQLDSGGLQRTIEAMKRA